jgi:hypothetical protein
MASKTLPDTHVEFRDDGQAIQFGSGDEAIFVWPDPCVSPGRLCPALQRTAASPQPRTPPAPA